MKKPISPALCISLAFALSAERAFSEVIDVRGPTPDYGEIDPAVVAAQDGDVIRIWPGTYQPFWIDDKSLTLVSADTSGAVLVAGTYRIENLSPDRSVEISGISANGAANSYALVVSDCRGSVRIRECVYHGGDSTGAYPWDGSPAVFLTHCDDVEMTYCTVRGGYPSMWEYGGSGGDGLAAEASRMSLYTSTFEGTSGTADDDPGASGRGGGNGVSAWGGGRAYVSGCTLIGGYGGDADYDMDYWTGEYGYGGSGGWGFASWDLSVETWHLDADFQPGSGGWSPDPSHYGYDGQDSTVATYLPGTARILRVSRLVDEPDAIAVVFTGSPGDLANLQLAREPAYGFSPVRGPFLLEPPAPPAIRPWKILGAIGPTGVLQTTIRLHDLPTLGHATVHFQGLVVGSETYYTASSWTALLDQAW